MNTQTQAEPAEGQSPRPHHNVAAPRPALSRPVDGRMLAGVAAGLARYLGVDVTIVRVVLVVLAFVGGAGVPLYLAGWLLMPDEATGRSFANEIIDWLRAGR
jgi:phage shock protein PspC (stress-responsive transcriptional regulator)